MSMAKQNFLAEIARAFGMNVSEFAEFIGYSRANLYAANEGHYRLNSRRMSLVKFKLGITSQKMFEADQKRAEEDLKKRIALIDELICRLGE